MVRLQKFKNISLKDKPGKKGEPIPLSVVEPQEALVPIFNSPFYMTPDEPADVEDCDRYPDSIYCGGVPWTFKPIDIEPSIVLDECNVGIELKPVLGFTKLPPVQFVHRKPKCRDLPPIQEQPVEEYETDFLEPVKFVDPSCNQGVHGHYTHSFEFYEELLIKNDNGAVWYKETTYGQARIEILEFDFPYLVPYGYDQVGTAYLHIKYRKISNVNYNVSVPKFDSDPSIPVGGRVDGFTNDEIKRGWIKRENLHPFNDVGGRIYDDFSLAIGSTLIPFAGAGTIPGIYVYTFARGYTEPLPTIYSYQVRGFQGNTGRTADRFSVWRVLNTPICACQFPQLPPPFPNLKLKDDMACCPEHTNLLKQLIAKVNKLSEVVGVDDYPVSLPASLISRDEGFFGNLIPNENIDVPSLTTFMAWYVSRFDEIMGQWEIPIEIKDSDPTRPGEQPVGIKLPNIAECMAEMFTLCFQTNINSETLLNMCMRTLGETEVDKQQNFITYKLLQSLTDWVGYKQKDVKVKMPLMTTLNKTRYDQILQESEVEVAVPEFDEKFGLEADLMRFREAASILQANYKVKVNPNGDIKAQILKYLLDTFKSTQKVNGEDTEQDFEDFLEEVEAGFINTPGVSNNTEPYGRPYSERPKIRDLTNYSTDNPEP